MAQSPYFFARSTSSSGEKSPSDARVWLCRSANKTPSMAGLSWFISIFVFLSVLISAETYIYLYICSPPLFIKKCKISFDFYLVNGRRKKPKF
jgi:hypothetical protein